MKKAFVAAAAVLLIAGFSFAATVVFDLNGNPSDGPDVINVPVSTMVPVDVWIFGPPTGCWVFGVYMCNPDHSLVYQSCVYNMPNANFSGIPPTVDPLTNCITVQGQNLSIPPTGLMVLPWKVATVTWHAAVDHSIDTLISGAGGNVFSSSYTTVYFDNNELVLATIQIGSFSTEETNWGAVKSLFR